MLVGRQKKPSDENPNVMKNRAFSKVAFACATDEGTTRDDNHRFIKNVGLKPLPKHCFPRKKKV